MRLANVPFEEGADAGDPVANVCQPAAAASVRWRTLLSTHDVAPPGLTGERLALRPLEAIVLVAVAVAVAERGAST